MSELTYAVWNANNAFGDRDLDEQRMTDALEVVRRVDAEVLYIAELAIRGPHGSSLEQERLDEVDFLLAREGYNRRLTTNYSDETGVRDPSYQALYSRDIGACQERQLGIRKGLELSIPERQLQIVGVHLPDTDDRARVEMAWSATLTSDETQRQSIDAWSHVMQEMRELPRPQGETVIGGDLNTADLASPLSWPLWALNKLHVGDIQLPDLYNDQKPIQRYLGYLVRSAGMAGGSARRELARHGFHQANTAHQPTCTNKGYKLPLDDIYGSSGVEFSQTRLHPVRNTAGRPVSDHQPFSTRITV